MYVVGGTVMVNKINIEITMRTASKSATTKTAKKIHISNSYNTLS